MVGEQEINAISVKVHHCVDRYGSQVTRPHRDVLYNVNGLPDKNNSQVPGSAAIILSLGDPKKLIFELHNRTNKMILTQNHLSVFVSDPRDEVTDSSGNYWKYSAKLATRGGSAMSLVFRTVQNSVRVYVGTGLLTNPISAGKKKQSRFDEHRLLLEANPIQLGKAKKYKVDLEHSLLTYIK